jgi:hypothetical protein
MKVTGVRPVPMWESHPLWRGCYNFGEISRSYQPANGWDASNQIQVAISIKAPGSRWRTALAVFFASVLLLVGYAQAAHFCAPGVGTPSQPGFSNVDRSSPRVPCLLCIGLHTPSLAAPTVPVLPAGAPSAAIVTLQPVRRSGIQSFALYIRPPPAA